MIGQLPIIDREGKAAASFEWKGTMWAGEGKWTWYRDDEVRMKITNAIKEHSHLRFDLFSDMVMDGNWVNGWQGFAGWFQALSLALTAFGLEIDSDNIVWPFVARGEPDQDADPNNPPEMEESVS